MKQIAYFKAVKYKNELYWSQIKEWYSKIYSIPLGKPKILNKLHTLRLLKIKMNYIDLKLKNWFSKIFSIPLGKSKVLIILHTLKLSKRIKIKCKLKI